MRLRLHFGDVRRGYLTSGGFMVSQGKLTIPYQVLYQLYGLTIGRDFLGFIKRVKKMPKPKQEGSPNEQ